MADWNTSWVPQLPYAYGPGWKTSITRYQGGKEQRRKKQPSAKHSFDLLFNAADKDTIDAIRVFFDAREGAFGTFTFPNFMQYVEGSRLACVNSNPDTITDSSSGLSAAALGFAAAQNVTLDGSGQGNDGVYTLATVAAGALTLDAGDSLAAESANSSLIIYRTYTVRFVEDQFKQDFLGPRTLCGLRRLLLVEVL